MDVGIIVHRGSGAILSKPVYRQGLQLLTLGNLGYLRYMHTLPWHGSRFLLLVGHLVVDALCPQLKAYEINQQDTNVFTEVSRKPPAPPPALLS